MLDAFTRQAYRPRMKLAGHPGCGDDTEWLERFQGTPLYDQAMELLQEELQQEAEKLQQREVQQQFCSASDQLRLKKKLLELELARSQMAPPTPAPSLEGTPEVPSAPPAGPPGAGVQATVQSPDGAPPKTASARFQEALTKMSTGGLGSAVDLVKKHPGLLVGGAGGTIYGAIKGGREKVDPYTGQRVGGGITGALGGALTHGLAGAGLGLGAQGLVRGGLRTREALQAAESAGKKLEGGATSEFGRQLRSGLGGTIADVRQGSHGLGGRLQSMAEPEGALGVAHGWTLPHGHHVPSVHDLRLAEAARAAAAAQK